MKRLLFALVLAGVALSCSPQEPVVTVPDGIEDNLYRFGVKEEFVTFDINNYPGAVFEDARGEKK